MVAAAAVGRGAVLVLPGVCVGGHDGCVVDFAEFEHLKYWDRIGF